MFSTETRVLVRYAAPTVVFGLLTALEGTAPQSLYARLYVIKIAAVTVTLWLCRSTFRDIKVSSRGVGLAVVTGLVVVVTWVGLDKWIPYPHFGSRTGFDPYSLVDPTRRAAFLAARLYGLVVVVPIMEELLLRSFVIRYASDPDLSHVPVGNYSPLGFWVVVGLAAGSHPEWLSAIVANVAYNLLLGRTRSLFTTIVAHSVTNGALGVYILTTHDWVFW